MFSRSKLDFCYGCNNKFFCTRQKVIMRVDFYNIISKI